MKINARKQLLTLAVLLGIYALLAFAAYFATPLDQLAPPGQAVPPAVSSMPRWQLALGGAGMVLVAYGLLGLAGYWFATKLEIPPLYRQGAGWGAWLLQPMVIGLIVGVIVVFIDQVFARAGTTRGFPHPAFPLSLIASGAAGIGEEILCRGFVMGLWALVFSLLLRRWNGRRAALWIGNAIAALVFSASHLPSVMILLNLASPAQIPVLTLAEIFLLNSFMGLVAGERYMRNGLVAAMGVHFWADLVWHVIFPLTGLGV